MLQCFDSVSKNNRFAVSLFGSDEVSWLLFDWQQPWNNVAVVNRVAFISTAGSPLPVGSIVIIIKTFWLRDDGKTRLNNDVVIWNCLESVIHSKKFPRCFFQFRVSLMAFPRPQGKLSKLIIEVTLKKQQKSCFSRLNQTTNNKKKIIPKSFTNLCNWSDLLNCFWSPSRFWYTTLEVDSISHK